MNIKIIIIVAMLCSVIAQAQPTNSPEKTPMGLQDQGLALSLTTSVLSEYIGKPGFVFYDKPVSQDEFSLACLGFYAGTWFSQGLDKSRAFKFDEELQAYAGYKRPIGGWFVFDGSLRYDDLKALSHSKDDLWFADIRLDLVKFKAIQPYVFARHFEPMPGNTLGAGWFVWFGAKRNQDLGFGLTKAGHIQAIFDASIAYSDGALSREAGLVYGRGAIQLKVPLAKTIDLCPQAFIQIPLDERGAGCVPYTDGKIKGVFGFSLTKRF